MEIAGVHHVLGYFWAHLLSQKKSGALHAQKDISGSLTLHDPSMMTETSWPLAMGSHYQSN